ncbi:hypothetical protein [Kitasatospora sp. NPDC094015]|uniref:hypothetical protein n=1 Tax=Kitasatospora sp. NPDC094015 TaxID=3155205 RepID=UPI00331E5DD6
MSTSDWTADRTTGGPLDEVFRRLREQVPDLVIEVAAPDHDHFLLRIATSPEVVELECRPGGRPPFTVSDEYSQIPAADIATATRAVHELLSA